MSVSQAFAGGIEAPVKARLDRWRLPATEVTNAKILVESEPAWRNNRYPSNSVRVIADPRLRDARMITYKEARQRVRDYLDELEAGDRDVADLRKDLSPEEREVLGFGPQDDTTALAIDDKSTIAEDFGWVFFYQSSEYLESGNALQSLVGNAPLIVSKSDGILYETGTAEPVEFYIENFKRCGDPFG